jgi:hypothetical protein
MALDHNIILLPVEPNTAFPIGCQIRAVLHPANLVAIALSSRQASV